MEPRLTAAARLHCDFQKKEEDLSLKSREAVAASVAVAAAEHFGHNALSWSPADLIAVS